MAEYCSPFLRSMLGLMQGGTKTRPHLDWELGEKRTWRSRKSDPNVLCRVSG